MPRDRDPLVEAIVEANRVRPERCQEIMLRCEWGTNALSRIMKVRRSSVKRWLAGKQSIPTEISLWLEEAWAFAESGRKLYETSASDMEAAIFNRYLGFLEWDPMAREDDPRSFSRVMRIAGSASRRMANGEDPIPTGIANGLKSLCRLEQGRTPQDLPNADTS